MVPRPGLPRQPTPALALALASRRSLGEETATSRELSEFGSSSEGGAEASASSPRVNTKRPAPLKLELPLRVGKATSSEASTALQSEFSDTISNASDLSSVPENLSPIRGLRFSSSQRSSVSSTCSKRSSESLQQHDLQAHYVIGKKLGEGRYGAVYQVKSKFTGTQYALKNIKETRHNCNGELEAELSAGSEFDHPFIVKLHAFFREKSHYHLVMDLCTGGDLMSCVESHISEACKVQPGYDSGLPSRTAARYMWQMLHGLTFLHHHGFIHRDIKPENYLLLNKSPESPLKLADFGFACRIGRSEMLQTRVGTCFYAAPELLKGRYDQKADVWSLGVTCFAICTNGLPFHGEEDEYLSNIRHRKLVVYEPAWKPHLTRLRDLVMQMMTWRLSERPSAKKLLSENLWLKSYGGMREESGHEGCCTVS